MDTAAVVQTLFVSMQLQTLSSYSCLISTVLHHGAAEKEEALDSNAKI